MRKIRKVKQKPVAVPAETAARTAVPAVDLQSTANIEVQK